ncbi:hypothetical protein LIP_2448 [Limnochorda pilosa]|uniref:Uncharacterized protein n=1 Tax=Limnochorda pilosa TaxID=1555112 RepID=A0A0K2SN92_LIMPI|nr:hypothetical protein LIP_2448 [Limnochorda pilosa]
MDPQELRAQGADLPVRVGRDRHGLRRLRAVTGAPAAPARASPGKCAAPATARVTAITRA